MTENEVKEYIDNYEESKNHLINALSECSLIKDENYPWIKLSDIREMKQSLRYLTVLKDIAETRLSKVYDAITFYNEEFVTELRRTGA